MSLEFNSINKIVYIMQRLSTANDFSQAFIKSLVEVDIPEYGVVQLTSSRYKIPIFEHNNLSPRKFAVKFLGDLIYEPSFNLGEIQSWDDESIEKALRAWLAREDSDKWILPEDKDFFEAIQYAYKGFLAHYLQKMQKVMEPVFDNIRNNIQLMVETVVGNLQTNLNSIINSFSIEIPKIQLGRFFENLPDFTEIAKQFEALGKAAKAADILNEGGYGFLLSSWTLADMGQFVGIHQIDVRVRNATVTNKLLQMTRQANFAETLRECFEASVVLRRRWKIIEQALIAHKNRNYVLSIPTLLAQVEGIFTDALALKGIAVRIDGRLCEKDITGKPKLDKHNKPIPIHDLRQKVLKSNLQNEKILQALGQFYTRYLVDERNAILHGSHLTYDTAKLSVQLLLNIYLLAIEFVIFENEDS